MLLSPTTTINDEQFKTPTLQFCFHLCGAPSKIIPAIHTKDAIDLYKSFLKSHVIPTTNYKKVVPNNFHFYIHGKPVLVSPFGTILLEWLQSITTNDTVDVRVSPRGGLRGGKGGFGAQLKALGKQGAAKKTTNFGACRDLNGRRLRHVNDALRLKIWREARAAAEAKRDTHKNKISGDETTKFEYLDGQTKSGISGWHLSIPSWADGVKSGKLRNQHKRKYWSNERDIAKKYDEQQQLKRARMEIVDRYASIGVIVMPFLFWYARRMYPKFLMCVVSFGCCRSTTCPFGC